MSDNQDLLRILTAQALGIDAKGRYLYKHRSRIDNVINLAKIGARNEDEFLDNVNAFREDAGRSKTIYDYSAEAQYQLNKFNEENGK